jgi:hypothetical protein
MFTVDRRRQVRARLLERAAGDRRITAAAITGSAAADAEDRWSDIDLFFGVAPGTTVDEALDGWSPFVYRELGAIHHFDLTSSSAVYRAFLLGDLLEIDLGFTPAAMFGPLGKGPFKLVFGQPSRRKTKYVDPGHVAGLAWHHVLHARICLERGSLWQAEHWISGVRDHVLTLTCLRLGLPSSYAKGADELPAEVTAPVREALIRDLEPGELGRALGAATRALISELGATDPALAATLSAPLTELAAV